MPLPTKVNVARPEAWGYQALLEYGSAAADSLYLRTAFGSGRVGRVETDIDFEQGVQSQETPEDFRTEEGKVYSRNDLSGGEGLDRAQRRDGEEFDHTRYFDSRNISISPCNAIDPQVVKLLHDTSLLRAETDTNLYMATIGNVLYMANGTNVDRTADPIAASPTFTVEDPSAAEANTTVDGLAALGDELYAAMDAIGIHKRDNAGVWAHWSDLAAVTCHSAKGRIIASVGTALHEAGSLATSILLHTLASGETWNDVVDAGSAVLAAASDGYVYTFAEEDGELVLKGQTLFEGEVPQSLGATQGLVFIGTSQATTTGGTIGRLWRSLIVGTRLREAQVIRIWGDGTETRDRSPRRIITTRQAAWTAVVEDGSETHMWKVCLLSGGVSRDVILGDTGISLGLAVIDERIFATVSADGLWREDTTFAASGYVIGAAADFFSASPKAWVGAKVTAKTVTTEETVDISHSTDLDALEDSNHASWVTDVAITSANDGTLNGVEQSLSNIKGQYLLPKLDLTPNTARTTNPEVLLPWAFRGFHIPNDRLWQVPIAISDQIEMPNRRRLVVSGVGDAVWQQLQTLEGEAVTLTMLRPDDKIVGQLLSVSAPIVGMPKRGSPTVYCMVVVKGIRV